jgi:hypothetical protein
MRLCLKPWNDFFFQFILLLQFLLLPALFTHLYFGLPVVPGASCPLFLSLLGSGNIQSNLLLQFLLLISPFLVHFELSVGSGHGPNVYKDTKP